MAFDSSYNFPSEEEKTLKFWEEKTIFDKLRQKNRGKKKWSFIDGPITSNNPMGVHHAWGRTYKDLFQRFKAMQGFDQRFQNGFDCQGLWIEREEEKALGLKNKQDIEKFGILNFSNACRARVEKFSLIQRDQSIRLGQWMDWENSYYTMTDNNNIHNWMLLKKYHEKGWLYKGKDAVPWCWRCGTASSKHDIATEGYKEVTHTALFMQFPIKGKKNEYFIIFTTTPWTVPANVAIALNKDIEYVLIKQDDKKYWLAETRLNELKGDYVILEKKKGKDLVGIEYEMPYKNLEQQKKSPHKTVMWELASGEEGTGIVHIAPGCGAEDFDLGKKLKLPAVSPLDDAGTYSDNFGTFSKKLYSQVNREVIEDLEERGFLYKKTQYKHRYPHCWRCGEELVFRLVDEWYIKCDEIREKLIKENQKITWFPEYGKIRQEDWFKNMGDWLISRKRYWGLPLPFWECSCGHLEVIGSLDELKKKAVDLKKISALKELHRPWIDEIKIKCLKCGKEAERVKDVGDAWLDAGIVPFSTINYLNNQEYWKEWFPADFICENMPGQYRGWFNALMWASVTISGKAPFKSILGYETLKDEKGEEMHKSKGNAIWFDEAVNKIGADPMRLLYCLQDPSQELKFGFNVVKEPTSNILILYNLSRLIVNTNTSKKTSHKIEDLWILSKLNSLIKKVTEELELFHPHLATRTLQNFWLNDFSRGYIQLVRERLSDNDESAQTIISDVYLKLITLCAPFMPFIAEKIYQQLPFESKKESIHLLDWPKADEKKINNSLEENMSVLKEVISAINSAREKAQLGLKWPVKSIEIVSQSKQVSKAVEALKEILLSQTNVKTINVISALKDVKEKISVNSSAVGKDFTDRAPKILAKLSKENLDNVLKTLNKDSKFELSVDGKKFDLTKAHFTFERTYPSQFVEANFSDGQIYLDKTRTPELDAEGFAREIMRKVQELRKKAGLQKKDEISLTILVDASLEKMLKPFEKLISNKCGAKKLNMTSKKEMKKEPFNKEKIKDKIVRIGF